MKQPYCSFSLKPKAAPGGNVTIKSDNVAMGLMVCLMGLLCAGMSIAVSGWNGESSQRSEPDRKPFRAVNSLYGKSWEEIDVTQFGFDSEPSETAPPATKDAPGGFDGKSLLMNHGLTAVWIVAALIGIRIMFTGATVTFDTQHALVRWQETSLWGAHSAQYPLSQVSLVLHETVVRSRGTLDWHGFAASLVNSDSGAVQLARSKEIESVERYAADLQRLTGLEAKPIEIEEASSRGLYRWRPFSLKR